MCSTSCPDTESSSDSVTDACVTPTRRSCALIATWSARFRARRFELVNQDDVDLLLMIPAAEEELS